MRVWISPQLTGVLPGHPAYDQAIVELMDGSAEVPSLSAQLDATMDSPGGGKGVAQEIVVVLSAPGSIAALVACWRLWLARDRDRSMDITIEEDGMPSKKITVSGSSISTAAVELALTEALRLSDD